MADASVTANDVTNTGYQATAGIDAGSYVNSSAIEASTQFVLGQYLRNTSRSIAGYEQEIADRQVQLAETLAARRALYRPAEKALVESAFSITYQHPVYGQADAWRSRMFDTRQDWISTQRARCEPPSQEDDIRLQSLRAVNRVGVMAAGFRQAEYQADALNDLRYSQQYSSIALGSNTLTDSNAFLSLSATIGTEAATRFESAVNSAVTAATAFLTRRDVIEPENRSGATLPPVETP